MMGNDNVTAYQYMSQYKFIDLNNLAPCASVMK